MNVIFVEGLYVYSLIILFRRLFSLSYFVLLFLRVLIKRVEVVGWSMYPTFHNGDTLFLYRFGLLFHRINYADIVLIEGITYTNFPLIKRVVGIPGDVVEFNELIVKVNGSTILNGSNDPNTYKYSDLDKIVLSNYQYFVVGDAEFSDVTVLDSRGFGPVHKDRIRYKTVTRY